MIYHINNKYIIMTSMEIKHKTYDLIKSIIVRCINLLYINIIHVPFLYYGRKF